METVNDLSPYLSSYLQQGDFVAFTFFVTTVAMLAGSVFFFFQFFIVPMRWKNPVLLMGLVQLIAGLNYLYMRDYWVETQTSPIEFRYFDWLLTVPLIATLFYNLIRPYGATRFKMIKMIFGAIWMLFFGYLGESLYREQSFTFGLISTLGAVLMLYEIGMGIKLLSRQPNDQLKRGYITMFAFIVVTWNIYPVAYLAIPGNLLGGLWEPETLDIMYNVGDILNKIVFSAIFFLTVISSSDSYRRLMYDSQLEEFEEEKLLS